MLNVDMPEKARIWRLIIKTESPAKNVGTDNRLDAVGNMVVFANDIIFINVVMLTFKPWF